MPFIIFLLLPWALDLWLTFVLADALGLDAWLFFVLPAVAGVILLSLEWQRVQAHWRALRRLEGSPWALWGSLRRALAGFLLILPGIGSACIAVVLLLLGRGGSSANISDARTVPPYQDPPPYRKPHTRAYSQDEAIEGEYRREE